MAGRGGGRACGGTFTRTLAYLTSTVLPRRPRARGRRAASHRIAWLFPRLEFLPMSRAAPLPKKGKRGSSFSAFFFQLSTSPSSSFLFFALVWLGASFACSPSAVAEYTDPSCSCPACFTACMQTDKASMLDEIIDYVKFLQLQVKASMKC